jgi:hypothetical protein
MEQYSSGINYGTQAGIFQGIYLSGNRFHNLIYGWAWITAGNRKAVMLKALPD